MLGGSVRRIEPDFAGRPCGFTLLLDPLWCEADLFPSLADDDEVKPLAVDEIPRARGVIRRSTIKTETFLIIGKLDLRALKLHAPPPLEIR